MRPNLLYFSLWGVCLKDSKKVIHENSLNFVHIIKEIGLMKSNTFFKNQWCTFCFDSEGTKILNAPRICEIATQSLPRMSLYKSYALMAFPMASGQSNFKSCITHPVTLNESFTCKWMKNPPYLIYPSVPPHWIYPSVPYKLRNKEQERIECNISRTIVYLSKKPHKKQLVSKLCWVQYFNWFYPLSVWSVIFVTI